MVWNSLAGMLKASVHISGSKSVILPQGLPQACLPQVLFWFGFLFFSISQWSGQELSMDG